MPEYHLRIIQGASFRGKRTTVDLPRFLDLLRTKEVGLIYPCFYPRTATDGPLPQKMAGCEGEHLKFVGLFDIDMPPSAPKLDTSTCTSLSAARAASPAFEDVVVRAEKFCAAVDGARAWFTGGKGVRIALTKLRPELFLKCSNTEKHTDALLQTHFPSLYGDAYTGTIQPLADACVYDQNGTKSDFYPKDNHPIYPKLLTLNVDTHTFDDTSFDRTEDLSLSRTIQQYWGSVVAYVHQHYPATAFASLPLTTLKTNRQMRKRKAPPRAQRYERSAQIARLQQQAGNTQLRALSAHFTSAYPLLANGAFTTAANHTGDGLKLVHGSGHCPMKGGQHRNIRDVAVFVGRDGRYTWSCFHPDCQPGLTGQLPAGVMRTVFGPDQPLNFSTHYQAAKLFVGHCLRGRAACLCGNGSGMYVYDERTGLWAEQDRKVVRNLICSDLPAWLEAKLQTQPAQGQPSKLNPRQYEDMSQANQVLDALLPLITDRNFANDLDAVPHMLSVANGLLDLRTLEVRPRCKEDKVTFCLSTPWPQREGAEMPTPLIDSFFKQFLGIKDPAAVREEDRGKGSGDSEGIFEFLRVLLGYTCLTGSTAAQILTFFYGKEAGNAKTATLKLISNLMEDYALKCERKLIVKCSASTEGAANPSLMSLQGRRMGYCEEFGEEEKMDDERVKALTGGGEVRARQLHCPEVQFTMTTGFLLASNNKPTFTNLDAAIQRRLVMIACDTMFRDDTTLVRYDPQHPRHRWRDPDVVEKLNTPEGKQQLLVWLATGAKRFYDKKMKLPPLPPSVSAFGEQIHREQDLVGKFVEECCEVDADFDAARVAEYAKRREGRHLYLKNDFARDFKEVTNTELTAAHENQLKHSHGVATRRLRVSGYTSGQTYYVGLRPATGEVDAGDESDGFV